MAAARPAFRHCGVALLRASTDPGGLDLPLDLAGPGDTAVRQAAWLSALWERGEVRAAIEAASPALAAQVELIVSGGCRDGRQVRKAALAAGSYLLRWQRRASPFGLFAGTGLVRVGGPARAVFAGQRVVARADGAWLGDVITRLQECAGLLDRIAVTASGAVAARGSRLTAPGPVPDGAARELAPVEVSVRRTAPVQAALQAAAEPVPFGDLAARLAAQFPAAGPERTRGLLAGLVAHGMLASGLRAPMTEPDALGYACARLREAGAGGIAKAERLVRETGAVREALEQARVSGRAPGRDLAARMRALSQAGEPPVVTDTVLDLDVRVPASVAEEACSAAAVLHRVSPWPCGHPAWAAYHARFLDRYGTGAVVPLLELVADSGLGFPAGYLGSAGGQPGRMVTARDTRLLALVQQAMAGGSGEIVLTEAVIADLAGDGEVRLPSRAEIAVEVRAGSLADLDRGRFTLLVTGTPRPGSSMTGRHAGLLPVGDRQVIGATFAVCEPGTVAAQLSFAPRKRRNENVARTGRLLPAVIPVGECPPVSGDVIGLGDLAVTADEDRFRLVRLPGGELVEPRVCHALEAGTHTPPLARFLAEVTTATLPVYGGFDFGAAGRLPYLPRVRYRRTVLAPARWLLAAGDLPGPGAAAAEWDDALSAWRSRWQVPAQVAVTEADRRQPVDLAHPFHRELLRDRLRRAGQLELRETAAPEDYAWIGRAHELAVPLAVVTAGRRQVPVRRSLPSVSAGGRRVLRAEVQGHPARFDEIVAEQLPDLVAGLGPGMPAWWFRRGRRDDDSRAFLAIFVALPGPAGYSGATGAVIAWGERLRGARLASGVTLEMAQPGAGGSGCGAVPDAALAVFTADSAAAVAQAGFALRSGTDPRALAAASMAGIAAGLAGSAADGMDWMARGLPREPGTAGPGLRPLALALAEPGAVAQLPGGSGVAAAWANRARALAACRGLLAGQDDPLPFLRSLLREHQARVAGEDPAAGQVTFRLARACALRFLAAGRQEAVSCP
jgi:thiopeptide-type bacteriocin biosynthesis protein